MFLSKNRTVIIFIFVVLFYWVRFISTYRYLSAICSFISLWDHLFLRLQEIISSLFFFLLSHIIFIAIVLNLYHRFQLSHKLREKERERWIYRSIINRKIDRSIDLSTYLSDKSLIMCCIVCTIVLMSFFFSLLLSLSWILKPSSTWNLKHTSHRYTIYIWFMFSSYLMMTTQFSMCRAYIRNFIYLKYFFLFLDDGFESTLMI